MKAYTIYVHDLRFEQPILLAAEFKHDKRAREFASERLASCDHYAAIEVWDGGMKLCHLVSGALEKAAA
ncbi:MAG: hypothetical protein ACHP7N_09830 [Caulobacterales bacterium]